MQEADAGNICFCIALFVPLSRLYRFWSNSQVKMIIRHHDDAGPKRRWASVAAFLNFYLKLYGIFQPYYSFPAAIYFKISLLSMEMFDPSMLGLAIYGKIYTYYHHKKT